MEARGSSLSRGKRRHHCDTPHHHTPQLGYTTTAHRDAPTHHHTHHAPTHHHTHHAPQHRASLTFALYLWKQEEAKQEEAAAAAAQRADPAPMHACVHGHVHAHVCVCACVCVCVWTYKAARWSLRGSLLCAASSSSSSSSSSSTVSPSIFMRPLELVTFPLTSCEVCVGVCV